MNDFNFDMEIDSILAEFTGSKDLSPAPTGKNEVKTDAAKGRGESKPSLPDPDPSVTASTEYYDNDIIEKQNYVNKTSRADPERAYDEEDLPPVQTRRSSRRVPDRIPEEPEQKQREKASKRSKRNSEKGNRSAEIRATAEKTARKSISKLKYVVMTFTGLVFGALSVLLLFWMLANVHPDSAMASSQITGKKRANIVTRLDAYANNIKGELLSGLTYIRKHYVIPEGDLVAPEAPTYNYGTTTDPEEVLAIIEEARSYGLLDDQDVIFDKNVDFYYDSDIQYYCDETLLVICWKELIENRICSCVEVKMADGSQLRRKLADDTYGSSTYVYATELAAQCNAVAAMNADYYAFRDLGITVYNHKLYRFDESNYNGQYCKYNATDSLLIDGKGDFHIFHRGDVCTRAEMEQYVKDNDIMFSIAFGPVLVENWEQVWCDWYPVGEVDKEYSRASISQVDQLHYLYMAVSFADNPNEYHPRCTINEFAAILAGKGVKTGYCLDGGQTGEVVFRGVPYNHIDYGTERAVSDIIYFASAIPASER